MTRAYLVAGAAGVAVLAALWLRRDAVEDFTQELEAETNAVRIEHIEEARELTDEVRDIVGDDLRRELCERLREGGPC